MDSLVLWILLLYSQMAPVDSFVDSSRPVHYYGRSSECKDHFGGPFEHQEGSWNLQNPGKILCPFLLLMVWVYAASVDCDFGGESILDFLMVKGELFKSIFLNIYFTFFWIPW